MQVQRRHEQRDEKDLHRFTGEREGAAPLAADPPGSRPGQGGDGEEPEPHRPRRDGRLQSGQRGQHQRHQQQRPAHLAQRPLVPGTGEFLAIAHQPVGPPRQVHLRPPNVGVHLHPISTTTRRD
nr:hypothetical protein GCM10020092_037040 [Actinoplanes digitatis]